MARNFNLREYHGNIMAQLQNLDASHDVRPNIAAMCGERHILFDAAEIGEIVPDAACRYVPGTVPWYRGIKNVRGSLYGIVDLAGFMWGDVSQVSSTSRILLAGAGFELRVGFLVDRVVGLKPSECFEAAPRTIDADWVRSSVRDEDGQDWLLVDVKGVMASKRIVMVNANEAAETRRAETSGDEK